MKKILLIEDNEDVLNNTAEILELSNYSVITAGDGKEGVKKALEQKPDLIICDIMMPLLDGYGVLHAIQKNREIKNTPFIFLTAKTERGDLRKGMELGADDYITKPFSVTELLNAVGGRIKKNDLLKQELAPGFEGLQHLIPGTSGKTGIQSTNEGRKINKYKRKQAIYSEGNHPGSLFYVLKGKVKTFKTHDNGKELVTELFGPGDFLGYVALLEEAPYKDTAQALEETELATIPKDDFKALMNNSREVSQQFTRLLANNITGKERLLIGIAYNSLRKKVAAALLLLCAKYNVSNESKFRITIDRRNLASIAGTAAESLIRTLGDFKNEKLVDLKDGSIIILNKEGLHRMAD